MVKLVLHCEPSDLLKLQKTCLAVTAIDYFNDLQDSDLIYIFNDELFFNPKIHVHFKPLKPSVMVIMRRQYFVPVCMKKECDCDAYGTTIENIFDFVFDNHMTFYNNGHGMYVRHQQVKESGFGLYVQALTRRLIEDWEGVVRLHGCEYESVTMLNRYPKLELTTKLFGLPVRLDEELFLQSDLMNKGVSAPINWTNPYLMYHEVLVCDIHTSFQKVYPKVSAEESFLKYRKFYPPQYDDYSLVVGFKYSTWMQFKADFIMLFHHGVTLLDIGSGNLLYFMIEAGIDVVVPVYEDLTYFKGDKDKIKFEVNITAVLCDPEWKNINDKFSPDEYYLEKIKGYANKYFILPKLSYADRRLVLVFFGNSFGIYQFITGVKLLENVTDFGTRQFRASVERKYIERMDMFEDKDETDLKIAMFSASNARNFHHFKQAKKLGQPMMKGPHVLMMISAEAWSYCARSNSKKRPWIQEYPGVKDFTIYNTEASKCGYDWMSLKNWEVLLYPNCFGFKGSISFNIASNKTAYYGLITNVLTSGIQNVITSPTMNKSVSTYIKILYGLQEETLHRKRYEALKSLTGYNDLRFHEKGMWSLSYYVDPETNRKRFYDVSGHFINLIFSCSYMIRNLRGYFRMKTKNLMGKDYMEEASTYEEFNEVEIVSGENRGKITDLWHTASEDYQGCQIAQSLMREFGLPDVDVAYIIKCIDKLTYPKGVVSITVRHDLDEFN